MLPLWKLKILKWLGIAKFYKGWDIGPAEGDYSAVIEGYWVAGTFYVTKSETFRRGRGPRN